jgi:glycosyltransferase involved in cell wall biosynthesis
MRVLHVVKTSEGAAWAALQARELVREGVEVHAALPREEGAAVRLWREAGCRLHFANLGLPVSEPWRFAEVRSRTLRLVDDVSPDLIHSHFVSTTLTLRMALGKSHTVPRIFQVPGPLHLEHRLPRMAEIRTSGAADYWIASSRCILNHYRKAGVDRRRLFLSYYCAGLCGKEDESREFLRQRLGLGSGCLLIGNVNFMYAPKYALGQFRGVKDHETLIDSLGLVIRRRPSVTGVLIGGSWGRSSRYEESLRRRAARVGGGGILMPGAWPHEWVPRAWRGFDCAVHVPISENCGGVVEPLLAGVPTVAARAGGLPEVVIDGVTGKLAAARKPPEIADAVIEVLDNLERYQAMAHKGRALVQEMFDPRRTSAEVQAIYKHILDRSQPRPEEFDSLAFVKEDRPAVAVA